MWLMTASDEPRSPSKRLPRPERQAAFRVAISAESRAAASLIAKGFRILARRWRSPVGEIDIVARRRQLLVFVEVKARASLEEAAESVNERQRRRIAAAAEVKASVVSPAAPRPCNSDPEAAIVRVIC
jgi:putative endonuclease